jgi:hypothetical protein
MLTNQEITGIADEVLRATLGSSGFEHAQVMDDVDQDGELALMVTARFKAGARLDGEVVLNALSSLRDGLLARGEGRFPYLRFNVEGEEPAVDADDFREHA